MGGQPVDRLAALWLQRPVKPPTIANTRKRWAPIGPVIRGDTRASRYCDMGRNSFRLWAVRHGLRPAFKADKYTQYVYARTDLDRLLLADVAATKAGVPIERLR